MRVLFAAALFGLLPGLSLAETIVVRSGEHGDFTRLVLDLPVGAQWDMGGEGKKKSIQIKPKSGTPSYDLSEVYTRIDQGRVASVTPGSEGMLNVMLSCDCELQTFIYRDRFLVVDIKGRQNYQALDTSDIPAVPMAKPKPNMVNKPKKPLSQQERQLLAQLSHLQPDGGFGGATSSAALLPKVPVLKEPDAIDGVAAHQNFKDQDPSSAPVDLGAQIAADLAAAATQGLLTPAVGENATLYPNHTPQYEEITPDTQLADTHGLAQQLAEGLGQLADHSLSNRRVIVGAERCVSDSQLRILDWVDEDANPSKVLGDNRQAVFGEFDRVNKKALKTYLRSLVYFGFGAEIREYSQLAPSDQDPVLLGLSYLLDGNDDPMDVFAGQLDCHGAAAVWSVLDTQTDETAHELDKSAILRAFESLPKHLREHLGPKLAERLSAIGAADTARDILRRLERAQGEETQSIALGNARLDVLAGETQKAEEALHDLAVSPGPEAPEALKAAVDLADAEGNVVPKELVELSAAFATEYRNSEDGPELWETHIQSLIINDNFLGAIDALSDTSGVPENIVDAMTNRLLEEALNSDDDTVFLELVFNIDSSGVSPKAIELNLKIARRFIDMGLPDLSLMYLDKIPSSPPLRETQIMRAEALLAMDQPGDAEIILIGRTGEDVDRLRARARDQMGDHEYAKDVYKRLGEGELARNSAWLSGDWQTAATEDSPFAPVANLIGQLQTDVNQNAVTLSDVEELFKETSEARSTLQDLLEKTQVDSDL